MLTLAAQSRLVWEAMAFKIMVGTTHPGYCTDVQVCLRSIDWLSTHAFSLAESRAADVCVPQTETSHAACRGMHPAAAMILRLACMTHHCVTSAMLS